MKIARHGVWIATAFLAFAFSARGAAPDQPLTLPEAWLADPDGLRERFVFLFEEGMRPSLHELADDALEPEGHYRDDFIRYMALTTMLAEKVDARLFFLIEEIPGVLGGERREQRQNLATFLGEMHFRTALLLGGPAGDEVGDGAPEWYDFSRNENGSTLVLDRTPEPGYNRWVITYSARSVSRDETVGVVVHDAVDRYGTYPGTSFMRVRAGRIFFTTPEPAFEDFFADPATAPQYAQDGRSFHPIGGPIMDEDCREEGEHALDGPEMTVFFDGISDDGGRMRASLFQINRDAYVPAALFTAQCVLFYEWDENRYALVNRACASDWEWGMSCCEAALVKEQ